MKKNIKIAVGVAAGVLGLGIVGAAFSDEESEPVHTTDTTEVVTVVTTEVVEAKAEANAKPPQPEYNKDALSEWVSQAADINGKSVEVGSEASDCPTYSIAEFNACVRDAGVDLQAISRELTAHVEVGRTISMPPACKRMVKQTGLVAKRLDQTGDELAFGIANVDGVSTAMKRYKAARETETRMVQKCVSAIK